jgi:3-oxoacyl-[acyl-carrier protein] reductase
MDLQIAGRVAIVGGASKGMGLAIARELAANGVAVALVARGREALDAAVAEIAATGARAIGLTADMTVKSDVQRVVAETRRAFADPDIVISNTNIIVPPRGRGFDNTTDDDFRDANEEYVMAPVFLVREVLPHMRRQRWGRIIMLTSTAVKMPHFEDHLLLNNLRVVTVALGKTLANENAPYNITVNNIAPGPIVTPAFEDYLTHLGAEQDTIDKWAQRDIPMGRCGRPEEIGAVAAFLASERASFITAQTLVVDGGYTRGLF